MHRTSMEPLVEILYGDPAVGQGVRRRAVDRLLHLPKLFVASDGVERLPAPALLNLGEVSPLQHGIPRGTPVPGLVRAELLGGEPDEVGVYRSTYRPLRSSMTLKRTLPCVSPLLTRLNLSPLGTVRR